MSASLSLTVAILVLLTPSAWSINIVKNSQVQVLTPGQSVNLSCVSDEPYTSCSWTLPSGAKCAQLRPNVSTMCRAASDVLFVGNITDCQITVKNLKSEYNGQWTCGLEKESLVVERSVELVVAQKGNLDWRDVYGDLTLTTGTPQRLICEAEHSRPVGKFTWHIGPNPDTNRIINANPVLTEMAQPGTGVANVSQMLVLDPKPELHGKQIYCSYIQEDHQKRELYRSQVNIGLRVNFLQLPTTHQIIPPVTSGTSLNISLEFSAAPRPEAKDITWEISGPADKMVFSLEEEQLAGDQNYRLHPLRQIEEVKFITVLTIQNVSVADNENIFTVNIAGRNGLKAAKEFRIMVDRPWPDDDAVPSESDPRTGVYVVISVIAILVLAIIITLTVLYAKKTQKWCFQNNTPYISPEIQAQETPLNKPESSIIKHHPYGRPSS